MGRGGGGAGGGGGGGAKVSGIGEITISPGFSSKSPPYINTEVAAGDGRISSKLPTSQTDYIKSRLRSEVAPLVKQRKAASKALKKNNTRENYAKLVQLKREVEQAVSQIAQDSVKHR